MRRHTSFLTKNPNTNKEPKHTTMSTANKEFQKLIGGYLSALAKDIAVKFPDVDGATVEQMAQDIAGAIDYKAAIVSAKTRRKTGPRKPKREMTQEERCMARTWGCGSGGDQCTRHRADGADLCTLHAKQNGICSVPCTIGPNGKRQGLWLGRIDCEIPFADGDGVIRIEWQSGAGKERIAAAIEAGEVTRPIKAKKSTKKRVKITKPKAEDHTHCEPFEQVIVPTASSLLASLDAQNDDQEEKFAEIQNDDQEEKSAEIQVEDDAVQEVEDTIAKIIADEDDGEEDEEDEGVMVHHETGSDGKKYMVDNGGNVYNDECEIIGTWDKGTMSIAH